MKNTWAGDGTLDGRRSGGKGVIEVKACRNGPAGSILSRLDGQGVDSVEGDRRWNTEGERLRWQEANLDAHKEHAVKLFVCEAEVAPGL